MPLELKELKAQFEAAMGEYISAIKSRKLALDEVLSTESKDVELRYRQACDEEQRRADAYHGVANQLRMALHSRCDWE